MYMAEEKVVSLHKYSMVLPKKINDEQKELLEKLQESYGVESRPHKSTFDSAFDRVKYWFKN